MEPFLSLVILFVLAIPATLILGFITLGRMSRLEKQLDSLRDLLIGLHEKSNRIQTQSHRGEEPTQREATASTDSNASALARALAKSRMSHPVISPDLSTEVSSDVLPPPLPQLERDAEALGASIAASHPPLQTISPRPTDAPSSEPSRFETAAHEILARIWSWIIVGDEHRGKGVTMEYAIATTWLVRIGVLVILLGIGFFLRYATVQGWYGPGQRILSSTLVALGLTAWGYRLLSGRYSMLGQGLAGAGFAALYLTLFTAHQPDYGLIGPPVAFLLMVIVTAAAGGLAVLKDSLLLAVLATAGGFLVPLLIPDSSQSLTPLLTYLLLLNLGMFAIALKRDWRVLHYLAFIATALHVSPLVISRFHEGGFAGFFPFLFGFFVLFSSVIFVYQVLHRRETTMLELMFLFLNATVFGGLMLSCVHQAFSRPSMAWLTMGLAVFYALHVVVMNMRNYEDRGLLHSFLALASFFAALSLPIAFTDRWITVAWSLQAFLMLWVAARMRSSFLRGLAWILYLLVLARFALFDLDQQFARLEVLSTRDFTMRLIERLFTFGVPIGTLFAASQLFPEPEARIESGDGRTPQIGGVMPRVCFWIGLLLFFLYLNREGSVSLERFFAPLTSPSLTLIWVGFGIVIARELLVRGSGLAEGLLWCLAILLVGKVFFWDFFEWSPGWDLAFSPRPFVEGFLMRLLNYGLAIGFLAGVAQRVSSRSVAGAISSIFGYAALAGTFVYTSLELWAILSQFLHPSRRVGLSIYWSLFAITLLLIGIVKERASLRGIGLVLLGGSVLKVFLVDFSQIDPLFRIIGFLVIGAVILGGSFLYFRFGQRFSTGSQEDATTEEEKAPPSASA